jgi:hypothetical protein
MRIGIATDHGGFELKEKLAVRLRGAGHEVTDFGARQLSRTMITPTSLFRYQHHPHAVDRRGAAGQVRASRHADGAGAAGLHDLEPRHALRSAGPDLAQPRPVRALQRPRLDAALVGASPHRRPGGECRLRAPRAASVTLDDIRRFRQLDSKAPGHPEYHWVSGVETTTGPLGQGVATSVGMAIAQKWLANRYNRPASRSSITTFMRSAATAA